METIEIKIDDTQVKYVMKYYGLNSKDFYHKRYTALSDFAQQAVDEKIKNLEKSIT